MSEKIEFQPATPEQLAKIVEELVKDEDARAGHMTLDRAQHLILSACMKMRLSVESDVAVMKAARDLACLLDNLHPVGDLTFGDLLDLPGLPRELPILIEHGSESARGKPRLRLRNGVLGVYASRLQLTTDEAGRRLLLVLKQR